MRVKKTYSIKKETADSIKLIAITNNIPDSYALDMIVSIFMRKINNKNRKESIELTGTKPIEPELRSK